MSQYRVAIAGHSQLPRELEVPDQVQLDIFRNPGALVRDFYHKEQLRKLFESSYNLVLVWIGSNDVTE